MKKFRVGIAGYGWASGAHITAINKTAAGKVTAIYSSRALAPDEIEERHGVPLTIYRRYEDLLADDSLDVISICSYPHHHARQAVAAAEAGKHLIIEKPLALAWKDCLAVRHAVRAARVKVCVCFECRFSNQFTVTRSILEQGWLGTIHYGEVDYYHGIGPWYGQFRWNVTREAGGSSLLSAGCHAMDALLLCMGPDVESVTGLATHSRNETFAAYEYPTSSVTLLKFRDGRIGKCTSVLDCWQPYYFHTHFVGSHGSLLDNKFYSQQIEGLDKSRWSELSMKLLDSGDVSDHPYEAQFEAFFQALAAGRQMPLTSLDDAMRTHQIIFAADRSAAQGGRPVAIR